MPVSTKLAMAFPETGDSSLSPCTSNVKKSLGNGVLTEF